MDSLTMTSTAEHGGDNSRVVTALVVVLIGYAAALFMGVPQSLTAMITDAHHAHSEDGHSKDGHAAHGEAHDAAADHGATDHSATDHGEHSHGSETGTHATHAEGAAPAMWTVIPFVLLLGSIAVLPLIPFTEHWWESNTNRFKVAAGLALVTLSYYAFLHDAPIEGHFPAHYEAQSTGAAFEWGFVKTILGNAILNEFIPFIVLLFSLYTISGGIRIEGDLQATPSTNASFMAAGGLLASFIGTTGAAMLLIRPLLETNVERKRVVHTVVFFIFIVCNCGGCLLPIGDPPLFLGYLHGVDFFWTLSLWSPWLLCNFLLIG
ncbi:MAG: sodium:proton antiporter, partial [Planctomycetota bacterium]